MKDDGFEHLMGRVVAEGLLARATFERDLEGFDLDVYQDDLLSLMLGASVPGAGREVDRLSRYDVPDAL